MTIDNEELMRQLQRAGMLTRQGRRGHGHDHSGPRHPGGERDRHHAAGACDRDRDRGSRHGQSRVLALLDMKDGVSQRDLAYLLGIRPQSLSELLDHLEQEDCIERRRNESDKRLTNVFLTEGGRERAKAAAEHRKERAARLFSVLTEPEKEQLATILDKLIAHLEEDEPED